MNKPTVWEKISSGRFLLTIAVGICFVIIVNTLCKILEEKAIEIEVNQIILLITNFGLIIQNVFTAYFNKKRTNGNGDGNGH